ncbi:MAG: hypothetical protein OXU76_06355 [Alphaproteobacteria bacterium]|nr:hypothetical protein [Alphaproteobacteria bacterium]
MKFDIDIMKKDVSMNAKRAHGQFYTKGNPFALRVFQNWAKKASLSERRILEPFAGANNIIHTLGDMGLVSDFAAYDLMPASRDVKKRDTIKNFPKGFDICITNPPWLARNSATRRGLSFPACQYDDLYKHCLELCLHHCPYVAALLPASYLQSGLFRERLQTYILLHKIIFDDTENPVCLALFGENATKDVMIYYDNDYIGGLNQLEKNTPKTQAGSKIRFNDPAGALGFISFDNTKGPSIRFCDVKEIEAYPIKVSSRFITRISGEFGNVTKLIKTLNKQLGVYRDKTKDVFLTPFKGIREDGAYRRRMEFHLARELIHATQ